MHKPTFFRATVKSAFTLSMLLGIGQVSHAKPPVKMQVTVIDNIPTTFSYNWEVDGKASVTCSGSTCSAYYRPPSQGTDNYRGAVLRLLLPDGRIVIAECVAKGNFTLSMLNAIATNDPNAPLVFRNCRIPATGSVITGEFTKSQVKLFMQAPSIDGSGRTSSETYRISGVLQPTFPVSASPAGPRAPLGGRPLKATAAESLAEGEALFQGQKYSEAFQKYLSADIDGDTQTRGIAEFRIATLFHDGNGVTQDEVTSLNWLRKSAANGDQEAANRLANLDPSEKLTAQITANPAISEQLEANVEASKSSQAAAASLLYGGPNWNSMSAAERAQALRAGSGSICLVLTAPVGAEIDIDGNKAGVSPLRFVLMRHGDEPRVITIKMSGYKTEERRFVPDGKNIPIGITLEKVADSNR